MMRLKPPLRDPQEEEGKEYGEEDCADDVSQIIIQGFDLVEIEEEL